MQTTHNKYQSYKRVLKRCYLKYEEQTLKNINLKHITHNTCGSIDPEFTLKNRECQQLIEHSFHK
ncbi:hypothetical protein AN390_02033 [Pseudoalteromonas sp. P1-11]|nr:hypothetical protein AN390_02033 [Pseudoalteromonas sp. P1-11]